MILILVVIIAIIVFGFIYWKDLFIKGETFDLSDYADEEFEDGISKGVFVDDEILFLIDGKSIKLQL